MGHMKRGQSSLMSRVRWTVVQYARITNLYSHELQTQTVEDQEIIELI